MRKFTSTEALAFAMQHEKRKPTLWQVIVCGKVVYEHTDIRLTHHYIKTHALTVKPIAKY